MLRHLVVSPCDLMDCSPPGSSVHGILPASNGMPFPPPGDRPDPGIEPASLTSLALAGWFFNTSALVPHEIYVKFTYEIFYITFLILNC